MFHGAHMRFHVHPYVRIPEVLRACMRTSANVRTRATPHTHESEHALTRTATTAVNAFMRVCLSAYLLVCVLT